MIPFNIIVTEKCNWICQYCVFPNLDYTKDTTLYKIERHIPYIVKTSDMVNSQIYLMGGEIGMVNSYTLRYLFTSIGRRVIVSTNGTFLEKNFHKEFEDYISEIYWHVDHSNVEENYEFNGRIIKGIVSESQDELNRFCENHPDVEYAEIECDISRDIRDPLSEMCMKNNCTINIDLVNERLVLCQRNFDKVHIPLSETNLHHALINFPKDIYDLDYDKLNCKSCVRSCKDNFNNNMITNKILLKKHLHR